MNELTQSPPLESWRVVWRKTAPLISTEALEALRKALESDDPRLIQGQTTSPPPLQAVQDWPVEAACLLGYCGWQAEGLNTVAEVEEFFARMCFEIDQEVGDPAACRFLLNAWDNTPRPEAIAMLLPLVELALASRYAEAC